MRRLYVKLEVQKLRQAKGADKGYRGPSGQGSLGSKAWRGGSFRLAS